MNIIEVSLNKATLKQIENLELMVHDINSKITPPVSDHDRFLKIEDVSSIINFGRKWIYEEIQKGNFPKPIKLGTSSRWKLSEIKSWMEKQ